MFCFKLFCKFHRKTPVLEFLFSKEVLQICKTFNYTNLKNICKQLLLLWLFCIPVTQKEKQAPRLGLDYTSRLFLTALLQVTQGMLLMYLRSFLEFFRVLQSYAKKTDVYLVFHENSRKLS